MIGRRGDYRQVFNNLKKRIGFLEQSVHSSGKPTKYYAGSAVVEGLN